METTNQLDSLLDVNQLATRVYIGCDKFLRGKYWAWKITLLSVVLSLFLSFPSYDSFEKNMTEGRASEVSMQIADMTSFWKTVNGRNTMFRVTVPLTARLLGLDVRGAYGLQVIAGIFLFYYIARIIERESGDRVTSLLISTAVAGMYAGNTSFTELRSMYDGVALFLLIIALWHRSPLIIGISTLLASFTDERAIAAAGFVLLWWLLHRQDSEKNMMPALFTNQTLAIIAAIVVHLVIRWIIKDSFGLQTFVEEHNEFQLFNQINNIPMGLWTGLEAGWLVIILSLITLILQKRWWTVILFLGIIAIQAGIALSVVDITRSMAYTLPAFLVALAVIIPVIKEKIHSIAMVVAVANLVFMNYYAGGKSTIWWQYPLPIQVIRWLFLQ